LGARNAAPSPHRRPEGAKPPADDGGSRRTAGTQTSQSTRPEAISLGDEERANDVVLGAVLGLWDVVNNLTRLRPSQRDRYRVTIFGSARAKPGTFAYEETKRVSKELAQMGCDIITGGGPGLMQAANEGVNLAGESTKFL